MTDAETDARQDFQTKRIFVKDFSFEAPGGTSTFTNPWEPEVSIDVEVSTDELGDDYHEVVLTLTVTVTNAATTAFMTEILQGGIFLCSGFSGSDLHRILHTVCPNLLFPYASEAVDGMTLKGSFPALMLQPVNFNALYEQNKPEEQAESGD